MVTRGRMARRTGISRYGSTVMETEKQSGLEFDIDTMRSSLVSVRSHVPEDALTAPILGDGTHGQRRRDR